MSDGSSPMLVGIAHASAWSMGFVLGHIVAFRARPAGGRANIILRIWGGAVLGCLVSLGVRFAVVDGLRQTAAADAIASVLTGLAGLSSFFILYVPFYYTVAASLSIQTLIAIQDAGKDGLPADALQSPQFLGRILDGRLEALTESGNLLQTVDGFRLTSRGRRIAVFFQQVKALWRLGPGG